jgi:hypothetical protein
MNYLHQFQTLKFYSSGMFSKLFGRKKEEKTTQNSPQPQPGKAPRETPSDNVNAITLLFPALPKLELAPTIVWSQGKTLPVKLDVLVQEQQLLAHATLGQHKIKLVGFSNPLPKESQQGTIHFSNWPDEAKKSMYNHQAIVICYYEAGSSDVLEQLLILYKVAALFVPQGLLGVADESAMTANPPGIVKDMFEAAPVEMFKQEEYIPLEVWTGVLKLFREDGMVWYVTRGFARFGKADLAFLAPKNSGEEAMKLFSNLLHYLYFYNTEFAAGHTADMGSMKLRFREPYEYAEYIQDKEHPALVVEKN